MKITPETKVGWIILNGSGWNHHKTVEALEAMPKLPAVPRGYAVLIAPISDKPLGLRCALVRGLARKMAPIIEIKDASGQPFPSRGIIDQYAYDDLVSAESLLKAAGFENHRRADGLVAEITMHDDGCEGEADGWAYDTFGCEVEKLYSIKVDQQSNDASRYLISQMSEQIERLKQAEVATVQISEIPRAENEISPVKNGGRRR